MRVSTLEQVAALLHEALGAAGCFRTWTDTVCGAVTDRPELAGVMDALRPGHTLAVWRLDRRGRSLPHLIETVRDLAGRGIGFRWLQEAIDTTNPGDLGGFHIFGSLAELDLISEPMIAGLAAACRRGRVGGRLTAMTVAKTKQVTRMVAAGTPLTEVAEVLGVSRTALYRHLKTTRGGVTTPKRPPRVAVLGASATPAAGTVGRSGLLTRSVLGRRQITGRW